MTRLLYLGFILFIFGCGVEYSTPHLENPQDNITDQVYADSLAHFEQEIFKNSTSPLPYWNRAAWHLKNARIKEGLHDLDLALEADSTYGPAWSAKADALYLLRQFDPCIDHLDVCLKYAPNHIPCKLRRAEMYIHLKLYKEAFTLINDALKINDQLSEAYWMKGTIYKENGELKKALSSFQTSVEVNPSFFDGYIALGLAYASTSNPLAVDYYNSAISLNPRSVEAKYNLAMYYQELFLEEPAARKIALEKSLALYETIIEIDSLNASAAFNQGFIYLEYLGGYSEAEYWFSQAIEALPYYHQAFYNRGLARESLDKNTDALEDYEMALKLQPDYTSAALAKSRVLEATK